MVQDIDIKSKRILLFDFDGTLIETASGNTFATDLTDMRIKMDVVNKALDLMQENGVKVFAIVSNQGGVEAGFVSGADIEAKIEYVLRCVHDLAVKRGIRGVLYEKRLCYSNDEQNPIISRIVVEVAQFDTQKINNPEISGKEYQEGNKLGFWNIREYVLARDGHKCQYCKGKSKDSILNVHHIESRKTGGNSPSNLKVEIIKV